MAIPEITIEKGRQNYYFIYKENIFVCPLCKKTFKATKCCYDCSKKSGEKIFTIETVKIYEGSIKLNFKDFNCNCLFGSFFRWNKKFKDSQRFCQHALCVIKKIKTMEKQNDTK